MGDRQGDHVVGDVSGDRSLQLVAVGHGYAVDGGDDVADQHPDGSGRAIGIDP